MDVSRRHFLRLAGAVSLGFAGLRTAVAHGAWRSIVDESSNAGAGFGPLIPDPAGLLDLPTGFRYQVISRMGDEMSDGLLVPGQPDGMAAFPSPDGKTVLICNHEIEADWVAKGPFGPKNERLARVPREMFYDFGSGSHPCIAGTTRLIYDTRTRRLENQHLSLIGTIYNCAGGPTPWNSWLTCEETTQRGEAPYEQNHGYVFEVPALVSGLSPARPIKEMGRYRHEAVAIDPRTGVVYLTEDRDDGLIYRFLPKNPRDLYAGGRLQMLVVRERRGLDTRNWRGEDALPARDPVAVGRPLATDWIDCEEIDSPNDDLRARGWCSGAARFARGEGMWFGRGCVFFACTTGGDKRCGQIWKYTPSPDEGASAESAKPGMLELFIEPNDPGLIENADNVTVAPWGDLIICEDGPSESKQYLVGATPAGELYKLARNAKDGGEFAGATFAPDGTTLFVNLQETGVTLAIDGPWRKPA